MMPHEITCTRRIQFCSGHRLMNHESKCSHLHGHNYVAFITCSANKLDPVGRVVDFSVIKEKVGTWIDKNWDHGFILHGDDAAGMAAMKAFEKGGGGSAVVGAKAGEQKLYLMEENPTAENMAAHLLNVAFLLLYPYGVKIERVQLWETENCYAIVETSNRSTSDDEQVARRIGKGVEDSAEG